MRDPRTFDEAAEDYDAVRPGYPDAIVDAVLHDAIDPRAALEIGCGTGQLTRSLARHGLRIHAIDLGPALARLARKNLAGYPSVTIEQADANAWHPRQPYDLVASASAFHWLPPERGFRLAADALRPGGTLAVLEHLHPLPPTGFHQRAQAVYARVLPDQPGLDRAPTNDDTIAAFTRLFEAQPHFGPVHVHSHRWSRSYSRDDYLRLLRTYSDSGQLPPERWRMLAEGLGRIIDDEFGGSVERPYLTVAWLAPRQP